MPSKLLRRKYWGRPIQPSLLITRQEKVAPSQKWSLRHLLWLLIVVFVVACSPRWRTGSPLRRIPPLLRAALQENKATRPSPVLFESSLTPCRSVPLVWMRYKKILKSQFGEDEYLLSNNNNHFLKGFFNGLCHGTYLEMGALNGLHFSNTYALHKQFDWRGLLVELSPDLIPHLKKNRPSELALVHAAVCEHHNNNNNRTLHYWGGGTNRAGTVNARATAGVWELTTNEYRQRVWQGVTLEMTQPVQCRPLQHIIDEELIVQQGKGNTQRSFSFFFDVLSLDCEGCEWTALQSIDWERTGFGVIVVEANSKQREQRKAAIRQLLEERGYVFLEHVRGNSWFVNGQFEHIYRRFVEL